MGLGPILLAGRSKGGVLEPLKGGGKIAGGQKQLAHLVDQLGPILANLGRQFTVAEQEFFDELLLALVVDRQTVPGPDRLVEHAQTFEELIHPRLHLDQGLLHATEPILYLLPLGVDNGFQLRDGSQDLRLRFEQCLFQVLPVLFECLAEPLECLALRFAEILHGAELNASRQLRILFDLVAEEKPYRENDHRIRGPRRPAEQPGQRLETGLLHFQSQLVQRLLFQSQDLLRIGVSGNRTGLLDQGRGHDIAQQHAFAQGGAKILQAGAAVLILAGQLGQRHAIEELTDLLAKRLLRGPIRQP